MEINKRWKAKTPSWFCKIIKVGTILASVGIALLTAESQVEGFVLPRSIEVIAQWFVVGGIVAAAVAKTAKSYE